MKPIIKIKRVYEDAAAEDGIRILVDRLWPRGVAKENLLLDKWAKDIAPTTALRKWFGHNPELWTAFQQKYMDELNNNPEVPPFVAFCKGSKHITLLFAGKDTEHTHALVLQKFLSTKL
ncbi:MAG: DUF488 family protein [Niabella sp.]